MADFRRKFSDAARRYIQLSYESAIHQDERMTSLKRAMICTILSSAGKEGERGRGRERERGGREKELRNIIDYSCFRAAEVKAAGSFI